MTFNRDELDVLISGLAAAAARRESQARSVRYGRHHSLHNDTGWRCWLETDAEHFVFALRRRGFHAWMEAV